MKEQLDKRIDHKIKTDFLIKLMKLILNNNILKFHELSWKQNIGAAMGSKPVPQNANIFMSHISGNSQVVKRPYLGHIFSIFVTVVCLTVPPWKPGIGL